MKKKQMADRDQKMKDEKGESLKDKIVRKVDDLLDLDAQPERIQPQLDNKESQEQLRKAMYKGKEDNSKGKLSTKISE